MARDFISLSKELAEIAALQLTSVQYETTTEEVTDEGGNITTQTVTREIGETQITPIYTLGDFISAVGSTNTVEMPHKTQNDKNEDYYENYGMILDLDSNQKPLFTENFTIAGTTSGKLAFVATAETENGMVTVSIEEVKLNADIHYTFQCFNSKDTTDDSIPTLLKPLQAICSQESAFLKVRIHRPEFILRKNEVQTDNFRIRIIPTKEFGNYNESSDSENEINMPFEVWYQKKRDLLPSPVFYYDNKELNFDYDTTDGSFKVSADNVYPKNCIAKGHPMRINVIFTQASA